MSVLSYIVRVCTPSVKVSNLEGKNWTENGTTFLCGGKRTFGLLDIFAGHLLRETGRMPRMRYEGQHTKSSTFRQDGPRRQLNTIAASYIASSHLFITSDKVTVLENFSVLNGL